MADASSSDSVTGLVADHASFASLHTAAAAILGMHDAVHVRHIHDA